MSTDLKALKARVDLAAVIQAHGVRLVRRGANLVAPCVFHREKTASFTVSSTKRLWKCFGCGVGGDVFKFLEMKSSLTLPQAIDYLHRFTGVAPTVPVAPPAMARPAQPRDDAPSAAESAALDRPSRTVMDRVIAQWQKMLGLTTKAQGYLKARGLWHPELLRALRIGYSSGSVARALPGGGKLRRQLTQLGLLNDRGNEFFYGRIVIPIFDDAGVLVGVYGRAISAAAKVPHLYLKGPHRGVFNAIGVRDAQAVILTEAPLDALSLMVLGFSNVTTSYGVGGFTADLRAQFVRAQTRRVYCAYDHDPAGDHAADQLAHDLAGHGIEVWRVTMPEGVKDPNDFLRGGGTKEQFQVLLDGARPLLVPAAVQLAPRDDDGVTSAVSPAAAAPELTATVTPPEVPAPPAPPAALSSAILTLPLGDRTYQLESPPDTTAGGLRAVVRATRDERTCVVPLNLYSDRARAAFVSRLLAAFRGQVPRQTLENDFFALLDAVEALSRQPPAAAPPSPAAAMTPADREDALAFLKRRDLIDQVLADLSRLGVVGEDDNKLLAYLVATSRKLASPLSLSVISGSSAGKSWLLNRVVDLMPAEDVLRFTRMSPRALFYDEPGRYKQKILHIEEAIGAKDADLGVRSMQSERRLANLVTMTDPKTGKLKTQETVVEGPLTYMTSSVDPLDYETGTRSFEIAIDESNEQTGRIVARELAAQSLSAIRERLAAEAIVRRHQNAQRLIEPLMVVNPYSDQLTFPSHTLRLRREVHKYIGLMNALALLFQHQRPVRTFTEAGVTYRYVEVAPADIAIANRLIALHLTRVLSDLPGGAQKLLVTIQAYVTAEADARGTDPMAITFNRRQIRELLDWSDHQLNSSLDRLVKLELIEVAAGSFGKRYVYTLAPDHRLLVQAGFGIEERISAVGLTPIQSLKAPADPDLSGSQSDLSTGGRTF